MCVCGGGGRKLEVNLYREKFRGNFVLFAILLYCTVGNFQVVTGNLYHFEGLIFVDVHIVLILNVRFHS